VDEAVAREGWKIVALTRLSPVFPFNLLNYAFGLTNVRVRDYVVASWAGTLPGTILYVYLGSLAGDLTRVATGGAERTPADGRSTGSACSRQSRSPSTSPTSATAHSKQFPEREES